MTDNEYYGRIDGILSKIPSFFHDYIKELAYDLMKNNSREDYIEAIRKLSKGFRKPCREYKAFIFKRINNQLKRAFETIV